MAPSRSRPRLIVLGLCLLLPLPAYAADSQGAPRNERRSGSAGKPIAPIYNPHTKSYFELRVDLPNRPQWRTAVRYARTKIYKGVRGRLAVVKDLETHSFLRANFPLLEEAWIGMRFLCNVRKLVWENGEVHERSAFKVWGRQWARNPKLTCRSQRIDYMPVFYTRSDKGFRWQASGPEKYFVSYFVEYPTGAKDPKSAAEPKNKPETGAAREPDGVPAVKPPAKAEPAEGKPAEK